ncbi:MAG TPA: M15 family metallopeptidase [Acidimicrobiales bacterium]|nr:M15 family metallopeptidase [Acidimicrobiales bacterium]
MTRLRTSGTAFLLVVAGLMAGCGVAAARTSTSGATATTAPATTSSAPPAASTTSPSTTSTSAPTTTTLPATTTTAATVGNNRFVGYAEPVTRAMVPYTWRPGCPVGPADLSLLHMSYWGFDARAHVGTMVVNSSVVEAVLTIFGTLFRERFPIWSMVPEDAFKGQDPSSMAADNTSGFNCRLAVVPPGQPDSWSVHADGEAIDVNPVQNPYLVGSQAEPPAGSAYLDRADDRPGMAEPGGQLNDAFASVGWQWGGRWTSSPDYQHFSATGG